MDLDTPPDWRRGLALSLVTVAFWGMLPVALKGLMRELDPRTITWARFAVAALVVGAWMGPRGRLPGVRLLLGRPGLLALVAAAGLCGNYIVYLAGLARVTPATAQTVVQLAPMSLLVGSLLVFGERLSRTQVLGLATFFLGLGLFFDQELPQVLRGIDTRAGGVALVAAAAGLWGVYALAQKALLKHMFAGGVLFLVYLAGGLVFFPLADLGALAGLSPGGWGLLAFSCLNTLVAYGAFAEALACWQASRVSAVLAATPLATACFAELAAWARPGMVPPETWTPVSLLGAFLVATGCGVAALGKEADAGPVVAAPAEVP